MKLSLNCIILHQSDAILLKLTTLPAMQAASEQNPPAQAKVWKKRRRDLLPELDAVQDPAQVLQLWCCSSVSDVQFAIWLLVCRLYTQQSDVC